MKKALSNLALAIPLVLSVSAIGNSKTKSVFDPSLCDVSKKILAAHGADTNYVCRDFRLLDENGMLAYNLFENDCKEYQAKTNLDNYDLKQAQRKGDSTRVNEIRLSMNKRISDFREKYPFLNR